MLALTAGEAEGLKPPEFNMEAGAIFTVTLRNTPVYPPETLRWLKQFDGYDLSPNQRRLLAYAHAHGGQFTSRSYQKFAGVHLYTALERLRISSARASSTSRKWEAGSTKSFLDRRHPPRRFQFQVSYKDVSHAWPKRGI